MELLDIYDAEGRPTGRVHQRGAPLGPGGFCLAATVTIYNSRGEILCTLRSPEKKLAPNTWESPGGSVLAGETSRAGAVRELREETGLAAKEEQLRFLLRRRTGDIFLDVYALQMDVSADSLALQPGETAGARWFPFEEWRRKAQARELMAGAYSDGFFDAVRALIDQQGPARPDSPCRGDGALT